MTLNEKHLGSDFDDFLREDGVLDEVEAIAAKRVLAYQIGDGTLEVHQLTGDSKERSELSSHWIDRLTGTRRR